MRELQQALDEALDLEVIEVEGWEWDKSNPKAWKQRSMPELELRYLQSSGRSSADIKNKVVGRLPIDTPFNDAIRIGRFWLKQARQLRERERQSRNRMPSIQSTFHQLTDSL